MPHQQDIVDCVTGQSASYTHERSVCRFDVCASSLDSEFQTRDFEMYSVVALVVCLNEATVVLAGRQ